MSDVEMLWVVLACLYLWECICWVPRGSVAFLSWTGGQWRTRQPWSLASNPQGGFLLAFPLPPLGSILLANPPAGLIRPEGLLLTAAGSQVQRTGGDPLQVLPLEQLDGVRAVGRKVRLGRTTLLKMGSAGLARHLVRNLRSLSRLPPQERVGALLALEKESLNTAAVEERWAEFRRSSRELRWLCNGLFLYLAVAAPLVIGRMGLETSWPWLVAALLGMTASIAWKFRRAHRQLFPEADDERFTHSLMILLAPATAVRALDALSRPLFETFHPLTVARVLASRETLDGLARSVLIDLHYPPPLGQAGVSGAGLELTWRRWHEDALQRVEAFLRESGLDPEALLQAPTRSDVTCLTYCPRCQAQFVIPAGRCADCGGLALVPFRARVAD